MSETKNLKLFKHDEPLETNENQFNIKKALHDNWDKLDEFGGKVNTKTVEIENKQKQHDTDISNIKQEQQEQNSKIESNTTESKDNTELLNQIMGLLPSTKGEGEHVTLNNTAEARFKKFVKQGNSKQETRSGKNKFDGNFSQGYDSSGKITSSSQFICNTNLINVEQNKKYTISNNLNLKIASIAYYKDNEFVNFKSNIASNTINIPENVNQIRFNLYREQGLSVSEINMCQLEEGEIVTDYEPYGASPSPEFPSKIRNVGDNVNLFNKDGNTLFEYDVKLAPIENGIKGTLTVAGTSKYCVMKLGGSELLGKTLIVHGNAIFSGKNDGLIGFYFGTNNDFVGNWITDSGIISKEHPKIERIFKIPDTFPEGSDTIYILLYANARSTETKVGDYVEYRDFKIEEGTQATAYSPYDCGNTEVIVCNKNLAVSDFEQYYNSPTAGYVLCPLKLKKGSTYKFTAKLTGVEMVGLVNYGIVRDGNSYEEFINNASFVLDLSGKIFNKEFTIDDKFIAPKLVCWAKTEDIFNNLFKNYEIQLVEKTNTDSFVQHKQQTILFPFTEGQRLCKGDYLAEDGIHHVRKQAELTETSGWSMGPLNAYRVPIQVFVGDMNRIIDGDKSIGLLSDRFVPKDSSEHTIGDEELYSFRRASGGLYLWFFMPKSFFTATAPEEILAKWEAYLKAQRENGNPLTIEYELAKEIIDPYTPEQQGAYNKLKKLYSYNEQTNVFSKNEISPIFNVEAIKNLNVSVLQQTTKES